MSNFDNKTTRSVADIVANIMSEKLHPNQQKLDVHEPEKDKLTSDDFKKLRAGKKADVKEEAEQLKEYESKGGSYTHKGTYGYAGKGAEHGDTDYAKENELAKAADKPKKPNRGKYGARQNFKRSTRVNEGFSSMFDALQEKGLKGLAEAMSHQEKTTMKHIPNPSPALKQAAKDIKPGVAGYKDRIDMLKAGGVKEEVEQIDETVPTTGLPYIGKPPSRGISDAEFRKKVDAHFARFHKPATKPATPAKAKNEEVDNDTYAKEVEDQKAKFDGNKKGADVAKASVQAVQQEETHTTVEVIDLNDVNGVQMSTIELDERELTAAETEKKESTVKSMKKNLQGFKDRYGKDAKSVMYATATKQAKGE